MRLEALSHILWMKSSNENVIFSDKTRDVVTNALQNVNVTAEDYQYEFLTMNNHP
jgi:hypothetical protein